MEFSHLGAIPAPSLFDASCKNWRQIRSGNEAMVSMHTSKVYHAQWLCCAVLWKFFSFRVQQGYQLLTDTCMKSLLKLNYSFFG